MSRIFSKGNNFLRQLGQGSKAKQLTWKQIDFTPGSKIKQVEANSGQSIVLLEDGMMNHLTLGQVFFWGWNFDSTTMGNVFGFYRQFPIPMTLIQKIPPLSASLFLNRFYPKPTGIHPAPDSGKTVDIRLGFAFLLLKDENGYIYSYGDNRKGQCGIKSEVMSFIDEPMRLTKLKDQELKVDLFDAGFQYGMALATDNMLYGWGRRMWKQYIPVQIPRDNVDIGRDWSNFRLPR